MKIICSWCKKVIGEKEPFEEGSISHAKCTACLSKQRTEKSPRRVKAAGRKSCGLCHRTQDLTETECCKNQVCEKCFMKHVRFTLCGNHFNQSHVEKWQDCDKCLNEFPMEMSVWYGTNKYNFGKLKNPPSFSPTHCSTCGKVIRLPDGGYTKLGSDHWCHTCAAKRYRESNPRVVE